MLSWVIKSNLLITLAKKNKLFLQKAESWKEDMFTLFRFRLLSQSSTLESFPKKYIRIVRDHVKVCIWFLSLGILSQNEVHGPHHLHSNIFHKRIIILSLHICISNLSRFWYLVIQQKDFGHETLKVKKNYTLILFWVSNISFFQIKR